MKNVILIGASNSLIFNGLRAGLNQKNINLKNLSLGGASILHICYAIHKKSNYENIKKADLIIIESNIIDVVQNVQFSNLYYEKQILKNIFLTYQELSKLNKKILVLLLPLLENENLLTMVEKINNGHRYCCNKFNFNLIDVQQLYLSKNIMKFYMDNMPETRHQMFSIMHQLGKNIAEFNFDNFALPLKNQFKYDYDIKILYPYEFYNYDSKNRKLKISDLLHKEICYRIQKGDKLIFPLNLVGYSIIAVHSWTHGDLRLKGKPWEDYLNTTSSLVLKGKNFKYIFGTSYHYNAFMNFYENNKIDNYTHLYLHEEGKVNYYDIISVMLIKNYDSITIDNNLNDIAIKKTLDFTHLYPNVVFIKDILEEYICRMDPIKQTFLQNQINTLKIQLSKLNSAKARIHNHLSYKLGQALIENSKSVFGFIRMPYVLSYIKDKHKFEQKVYEEKIKQDPNLALPSLEAYPDYNEALKEKECFTYKLGKAFIKANKNWYGGGISNLYSKMCLN